MARTAAAARAAATLALDCSSRVDSAGDKVAVPGPAEVGIAGTADHNLAAEDNRHQAAADNIDQPCR